MNSVIGICDSNAVYMKKLAESFMHKSDIPLQIMTFSDGSQLIEYLKEHSLDILIADGVFLQEYFNQGQHVDTGKDTSRQMEVIKQHTRYILELSDEKGGMEKSGDFGFRISRYQSSVELFTLIRQLLAGNRIPENREKKNLKAGSDCRTFFGVQEMYGVQKQYEVQDGYIITVYSPVNRCGKTSLAVILTEILNQREPSLMVCMDHYSAVFSGEDQNLAELIYHLSGENNLRTKETVFRDFTEYENYIKIWEGLSYIAASKTVADLVQISSDQMCRLVDMLKHRSRYRYIIMDLSEGMENIHKILEQSDCIFMPVLDDCISRCKIEMFDQHMQSVMESEKWKRLSARIHRIQLPPAFETGDIENYYRELAWSDQAKAAEELLEKYYI